MLFNLEAELRDTHTTTGMILNHRMLYKITFLQWAWWDDEPGWLDCPDCVDVDHHCQLALVQTARSNDDYGGIRPTGRRG